jgi:hypothetical protein
VRALALALGLAYLGFSALGIWLLIDGQTGAGETIFLIAMAGGWFGSRWIAKRVQETRERDKP